jgi:MFS family permease
MYGYVTAIYSIGTALSAPLFGYWSNRAGQTRLPAIAGMIMMLGANLLYALVQCFSMHRQIVILIARLAVGIAAGKHSQ